MRDRKLSTILVCLVVVALLTLTCYSRAVRSGGPDQAQVAWERAQRIGAYRYSTDIVQSTTPLPKVVNTGLGLRQEAFHLEGHINRPAQAMRLLLWKDAGSVSDSDSGLEIAVEQGTARARAVGGEWHAIDSAGSLFAPGWDPMAYLAGIRDLRDLGPETRRLPDGSTLTFARYSFALDGPALAQHIRGQLEDYLRSSGKLPAGVRLDVASVFRDATGQGELWLDSKGLPLRLTLEVAFPAGERERVTANLKTDFAGFGQETTLLDIFRPGGARAFLAVYLPPLAAQRVAAQLALAAAMLSLMWLVVAFRRLRAVRALVSVYVILAMLVIPLLQNHQVVAFTQGLERQQGRGVVGPSSGPAPTARALTPSVSLSSSPADTGAGSVGDACSGVGLNSDLDNDGLTCAQEIALGADPLNPDSDGDLLPDGVEVKGFDHGGQRWNTDPLSQDTNQDGLQDGIECPDQAYMGDWNAYRYIPSDAPWTDTDGNGTPDVLDRDNDGDGVPDDVDLSPTTRLAQADTLGLIVNDLQPNKPVLVDLMLTPSKVEHLWWALNVLDWPSGDEQGQVQRASGNDATYANLYPDGADPRFANGDMRLVPMLEVSIPWDSQTLGNLPVKPGAPLTVTSQTDLQVWLDAAELEKYGVAVKAQDDHGNLLAYVPLALVTDNLGGARVAFSARMPYRPVASQWGAAQQMRVVWLVHALTDACTAQDANGACTQWSKNNEQIIQTYYEPFTVAGLSVREDLGARLAVVYKDPAADASLQEDALWSLADKLESTFIAARDDDGDGQRDITVPEIARRFNHASNASLSLEARWGISNTLSVVTRPYASRDEMLAALMATDVQQILNSAFGASATPTLLFASEQTYRCAGLDHQASVSSTSVTIDLATTTSQVLASLQWRPYVHQNGAWINQPLHDYLDHLDARLLQGDAFFDPAAPGNDQESTDLKLSLLNSYYLALTQGVSALTQDGDRLLTHTGAVPVGDAQLMDEELAAGKKFQGLAQHVVKAAYLLQGWYQNRQIEKLMTSLGYKNVGGVGGLGAKLDKLFLQIKGKWAELDMSVRVRWGAMGTACRIGTLAGAGAIVAGIGVGLYFLISSDRDTSNKVQIAMASLTFVMSAVSAVQTITKIVKAGATAVNMMGRLQSAATEVTKTAKAAALVGAIIAVGVTVAFFIYSMVSAGVRFGSLEFDVALANTLATSVALVIMIAIFFIPVVGQIIAAVLGLIDAVIALICALAGEDSESSWICGGISGYLAKGIAWLLYGYHGMVDLDNADRLKTSGFGIRFAAESNGFAYGSQLIYHLGVTNTIQMTSFPVSAVALPYFWQWTNSRVKSSAFKYVVSTSSEDVAASRGDTSWRGDDPFFITDTVTSAPISLPQPGINRTLSGLYLNEGYAVPVQECWGFLAGVCYVNTESDTNHLDMGPGITYDVFPASLDAFGALTAKESGYALAWGQDGAIKFPRLKDADGDGLLSKAAGGADPDDLHWDTDGDGLSDLFELQVGANPTQPDTDYDGLMDREELLRGSSPLLQDSDGDTLSDGEEAEGWLFVYGYQGTEPLTTRVWPDPQRVDGDADGYGDAREKAFGFHPRVPSAANILTLDSQIQEPASAGGYVPTDGIVRAGATLHYTATVANGLDERYAQGLLRTEFPPALQSSLAPQSFVLHPLEQSILAGDIQVAPDAASGLVTLTQVANAQITDPRDLLGAPRVWLALDEEAGATTFADSAGITPPYNATCTGGACPDAGLVGLVGHAARFDGRQDYLSISNLALGSTVAAFAAWVKPDSVTGTHAIIQRGGGANALGVSLGIQEGQIAIGGNSGSSPHLAGAVHAGVWTHIAAVFREYATAQADHHRCEVYVNGEHVDTFADCAFQLDGAGFVTRIGSNTTHDGQFFGGLIDDLRIYTHAPTSWHVPTLQLGFDQPAFTDESDYKDPLTCQPACPARAGGIAGQAAVFDGSHYLDVTLPGVAFDQYTLSAWVYPQDTGNSAVDAKPQGVLGVNALNYKAAPSMLVVGRKVMTSFGTGTPGGLVQYTTDDVLTRNAWNHIAVTFGASKGLLQVYVNGAEKGRFDAGTKRPSPTMYYTKMTQVGSTGFSDFRCNTEQCLFNGKIDDLAIYREAFSPEDVNGLYESGAQAVVLGFDDPAGGVRKTDDPGKAYLQNGADATGLHNGTCTGSGCPVLGVAGREWRAALFDGVDDVVVLDNSKGDAFAFSGASPQSFSLAAWVYPQGAGAIVAKYDGGSEGAYFLSVLDGGRLRFHREVSPWFIDMPGAVPFGQWSHVAATYDGATMRIYISGTLAASMASTGTSLAAPSTPVIIGALYTRGSFSTFFHGMLDDVRVYRRALGADEVSALCRHAPLLQLSLDEEHGATTFVDSANALNGTCSGEGCPSAGLKGQVGLAAALDGVDDVIRILPSDALNMSAAQDLAVSLWVRSAAAQPDLGQRDNDIVAKWSGSGGYPYAIRYVNGAGPDQGTVYAARYDGVRIALVTSTHPIDDGLFHHIAFVKSGGTLSLYVDGQLSGAAPDTTATTSNSAPLTIGQRGSGGNHFGGVVDELWLYGRALSSLEVFDLYRAQSALVEDRQHTYMLVDAEPPVSVLRSDRAFRSNQPVQLLISASDRHSGVARVELAVNSVWQDAPVCQDASGSAYCPLFTPAGEGRYQLQTRATDKAGNVEATAAATVLYVDVTPPQVTPDAAEGALLGLAADPAQPTAWRLSLAGAASDPALPGGNPGSGVAEVRVTLAGPSGKPVQAGVQRAGLVDGRWQIDYVLHEAAPNGPFAVQVQAVDAAANVSAWRTVRVRIDGAPPQASLAFPRVADVGVLAATRALTQTGIVLSGAVSDTLGSVQSGVAALDVALTPNVPGAPLYNELPPASEVLHLAFEDMPNQNDTLRLGDVSGQGNDGTCRGASCPQFGVLGHSGRAMQFDGAAAYVTADAVSASAATTTVLSLAAWVYPLPADTRSGALLAFSTAAGSDRNGLFYDAHRGVFKYADPQAGAIPSRDTFAPGRWVHVLVTLDASNRGVLYVNGQPQAQFTSAIRPQADGRFSIGQAWHGATPGSFFCGILDEVRVFARALSADEASALCAGSGPALHLSFDDSRLYADGAALADASGWQQLVTAHSGRDPALNTALGKVGALALVLDGVDDVVDVRGADGLPSPGIPTGNASYSLMVWINPHAMGSAVILGWGRDAANQSTGLRLLPTGLRHDWGGNNQDAVTGDLSAAWHHVAATYDGAARRLYLDGVEIAYDAVTGHAVPDASHFLIGAAARGGFFRGQLDEVRVYPRALSPSEIAMLAAGGWRAATLSRVGQPTADWTYALPAGLEGHYRLDLRGVDQAGNEGLLDSNGRSNAWSGIVDTLAPRVTIRREAVAGGYRYTTVAQDFSLSENGFTSPCGAGVITARQNYAAPWYLALLAGDAAAQPRLYQLTATCVLSHAVAASATACDALGHCTTVSGSVDAQGPEPARTEVAGGTVAIPARPTGTMLGPPTLDVTGILTGAAYTHAGNVILRGAVHSDAGVASVSVLAVGAPLAAPLTAAVSGDIWRAAWNPGPARNLDGATVDVTVRATDLAGQTTEVTQAVTIDVMPPSPATLTLRDGDTGAVLDAGAHLTATRGSLRLEWTNPRDGSGLGPTEAVWSVMTGSTLSQTVTLHGLGASSSAITVNEAQRVSVDLGIRDVYGNERWQGVGPVIIDGPRTPDDIALDAPAGVAERWMESGCTLLGVDARLQRQAVAHSSQDQAQRFYATWDTEALRLAWTGANWEADGDLFVYLDVRAGGSPRAYDPYTATVTNTAILLPYDAVASAQMAADYVVWVQDADQVRILSWDGDLGAWQDLPPLFDYVFRAGPDGGDTHLRLPFDLLGIADPAHTALSLVALASEQDALRLWATMPPRNILNSDDLLDHLPPGSVHLFALSQKYTWSSLGSGICPNGLAGDGPVQLYRADARFELSADPVGGAYHLLGDHQFHLMDGWDQFAGQGWDALRAELCQANPGDPVCRRAALPGSGYRPARQEPSPSLGLRSPANAMPRQDTLADVEHPALGDGQRITYTLRTTNLGAEPISGLTLEAVTLGPLRLPAGQRFASEQGEYDWLRLDLGDLAPGQQRVVTFTGQVDLRFDVARNAGWAAISAVVYDRQGSAYANQHEWLYLDHAIDQSAPEVGIQALPAFIGPGLNRVTGYSADRSAVPTVTLQVRLPDGQAYTQVCTDVSPADGQWAGVWEAPATYDGAAFQIRARGTDSHGQVGAWTRWITFTQDLTPPEITLNTATQRALADGLIGPDETVLGGYLRDNRMPGGVQVCDVSPGITGCTPHLVSLRVDASAVPTATVVYDDVPAAPLPLGASQTCAEGRALVRTYVVEQSFDVAGVQVGLNLEHPARADVSAWLVAPSGTTVQLLQAGAPARNYDVLLSDGPWLSAAQDRSDHVTAPPLYDQVRRPYELLELLNGEPARGTWRLILCDTYPQADDGLYNRSRLILTPDTLPQDGQGSWRYDLAGVNASDNTPRALTFYGLDSVGNRTALSLTFRVDTVAPALTVRRSVSAAPLEAATVALEGAVHDGGQVDHVLVLVQAPQGESYTEYADRLEEGRWAYALAPRQSGLYTLRVRATDRAGNSRSVGPFQVLARAEYRGFLPLIGKR